MKSLRKKQKMNSDSKIYLSREEQTFLMDYLELNDPMQAVEKFAELLVAERADPGKLEQYVKKIMKKAQK